MYQRLSLSLAGLVLAMGAAPVAAHETDQYSVPAGREFADLGLYFSDAIYDTLERSVAQLNAQIARALKEGGGNSTVVKHNQDPATVVDVVYHAMPLWYNWVEPMEARLLAPPQRERFPGLITAYQPPTWIYHHWALVIDPTKLPRLVRCGTIMVGGVYFGTDKLMHFTHVGFQYYEAYHRARAAGEDEAQATRSATKLGTGGHPFLSEATWLGLMTTGVWSNADLAANYVGMLFFRNLTEEVAIRGEPRQPMLVRDGDYWRINDYVKPGVDLLSPFVTDHWDEVLNPNLYGPGIEPCVASGIRDRCESVREWYRDRHLILRTYDDFERIADELSTYYGTDYGRRGDWSEMASYAGVCLDSHNQDLADADSTGVIATDDSPDALGRTALWWAAADGDVALVKRLLAGGAAVNVADIDGETALHAAARAGSADVIAALVRAGATVNRRAAYGATALHVAVRGQHQDAVDALLSAGALADIADDFGSTPLDIAAGHGPLALVQDLVARGADPQRSDRRGRTARDRAERAGLSDIVDWFDGSVVTVNSR